MFGMDEDGTVEVSFPKKLRMELTEIPVILVKGEVKLFASELKELSPEMIKNVAKVMGGTVGYLKVEAYYKPVENEHGQVMRHCTRSGCWSLITNDSAIDCGLHHV